MVGKVDLGDVSFGLGANTQGLDKAVEKMHQLEQVVNKLARSQEAAANKLANAYESQGHRMRDSLQTVLDFQSRVSRMEAPTAMAGQATRAFQSLANVMSQTGVATVTQTRAMDLFEARMGVLNRRLGEFSDQSRKGINAGFNEFLRDMQSASVLAVGPLSGLGARVNALGSITSRSSLAIAGFLGFVTAMGVGFYKLQDGAFQAAKAIEQIQAVMAAATGSSAIGRKEFDFVSKTAVELGLDLKAASEEYARLMASGIAAGLSLEEVRKVFLGAAQAGTALHLSGERMSRMLLALTQMMSKGRVGAQEMVQQLGDALPGAIEVASKAMGMSMTEFMDAMERGEISANKFVKAFGEALSAQYAEQATKASDTLTNSLNRMATAQFLFNKSVNDTLNIGGMYKSAIDGINNAIMGMSTNMEMIVKVVSTVGIGLAALFAPMMLSGLARLAGMITGLALSVTGLGTALTFSGVGPFIQVLSKLLLVAGAAGVTYEAMTRSMDEAKESQESYTREVAEYIEAMNKAGGAQKSLLKSMQEDMSTRITELQQKILGLRVELEGLSAAQEDASDTSSGVADEMGLMSAAQGEASVEAEVLQGKIQKLEAALSKLLELQQGLNAVAVKNPLEQFSKAYRTALDKITEKFTEFEALQNALASKGAGAETFKHMMGLVEAQKLLKDVPDEEVTALGEALYTMGFKGSSTAEQLAGLMAALKGAEKGTADWLEKLKATPDIIEKADIAIGEMQQRAAALAGGPDVFERFEHFQEHTAKIERFREQLAKTTLSQEEINEKTREYADALEAVGLAEIRYKELEETLKGFTQAFERGFDRIGSSITKAFIEGKKEALDFRNILNAVLSEIMQFMLDITLLTPIKKWGAGVMADVLWSGFGGVDGGATGAGAQDLAGLPVPAAKGLVVANDNIRMFAKGGLLNQPTMFNTGSGPVLAREAGNDEGVFPLRRMSNGDLGVQGTGGGGSNVFVNITNNSNAGVDVQQRQGPKGVELEILIDETVAKRIKAGGATARAISDRFAVQPALASR